MPIHFNDRDVVAEGRTEFRLDSALLYVSRGDSIGARKEALYSAIQKLSQIRPLRRIHQDTTIPIAGKWCENKSL